MTGLFGKCTSAVTVWPQHVFADDVFLLFFSVHHSVNSGILFPPLFISGPFRLFYLGYVHHMTTAESLGYTSRYDSQQVLIKKQKCKGLSSIQQGK